MKLKFIRLSTFLLLSMKVAGVHGQTTTYTSPNAGVDGVNVADMVHLDFRKIYQLRTDQSGGIIGKVQSGGSIVLEVFEYDPSRSQGIGNILYKLSTSGSTNTYAGSTEKITVNGTRLNSPLLIESDNIKELGQKTSIYAVNGTYSCLPSSATLLSAVMKDGVNGTGEACEYAERYQPVILKVTQNNATATSVKVPGIGVYNLPNKDHRVFAVPNGKIVIGAHRGNWENPHTPENTRSALQAALDANADMIELDIAITSDGVPVIFHDNGLTKRTKLTGGPISSYSSGQVLGLSIRNRFDELLPSSNSVTLISLDDALTYFQNDPRKTFLNLDKSANDMATFKKIYQVVKNKGMIDRCIFKGRFAPSANDPADENLPTVAGFRKAFAELYPSSTVAEREQLIADMYFTPVMFDDKNASNDDVLAEKYYKFIQSFVNAGFADGFELNFKALPGKYPKYSDDDSHIMLLRRWSILGNGRNFVDFVHNAGLPVGIFASEPEVGAVPQYTGGPTSRDLNNIVSGTVWELSDFLPKVQDQPDFDFRGNPDFYIPAGADYVITDRPDQLLGYLRAISRSTH